MINFIQNKYLIVILFMLLFSNNSLFPQTGKWISKGIGGGGGLFVPAVSPHNNSEFFVPTDMGALFHSTTKGTSWSEIHFKQIIPSIHAAVQFTSDPNILYAISGWDFPEPVKSTDGGTTWRSLTTDPTNKEALYIFADDSGTNRIIVSDYFNLFFSKDAGITFTKIYSTSAGAGVHIGGVFWNGDTILAGTNFGILESLDGGNVFTINPNLTLPADEKISSFTAAKQNGIIRLYCVTLNTASIYGGVTGADFYDFEGIYKVDYGTGTNWTKVSNGFSTDKRFFFVANSKNNINAAYIAGGDVNTSFPIIYKTIDAGNTWTDVFKTNNNENIYTGWSGYQGDRNWWYGEYALGLTVARNNPDVAIMTDLGYIHSTDNGGTTWSQNYVAHADQNQLNHPTPKGKSYHGIGIENTSVWWLTWNNQNNMFASFTDITAIRSTDGGESWSMDYNNLNINSVYMTLKHPVNGKLYAATSSVHDMYQETRLEDNPIDNGTGDIRVSADNGRNWNLLHDFGHPVVWIAFHPNNPNKMYASVVNSSSGGIYKCEDIESNPNNWTKLTTPAGTEGHPYNILFLNDGTLVVSYSGRIDASIDNFTPSSGIFISSDDGATWQDRSHNDMKYWTKDVIIDPSDNTQNTWYACVNSGWGGAANDLGGLYKTTDRGLTWTNILDLFRVESCAINPNNNEQMVVTTYDEGLWTTKNLHSSSPEFSLVKSYPFQHPVRAFFDPYNEDKVWITSFGNGLKVGNISTLTGGIKTPFSSLANTFELSQNYPNPFNPTTTIQYTIPAAVKTLHAASQPEQFIQLKIYDILGNEITTLVNKQEAPGIYKVTFNAASLPSGIYFYKLKTNNFTETKHMVLIK